MIRVKYKLGKERLSKNYRKIIKFNEDELMLYKSLHEKFKNLFPKDIYKILFYSIRRLAYISFKIDKIDKNIKIDGAVGKTVYELIKSLFEYKKRQSDIALFFMNHSSEIRLSTCYYCNIEYINKFTKDDDIIDFSKYRNALDFVHRGSAEEFKKIKGITDTAVNKILTKRDKIKDVSDLKLGSDQQYNLENYVLAGEYNHFTLDHVLGQAKHPIAALSLHNFVPSCYSCNSKLKGDDGLITSRRNVRLSPTHKQFNFNEAVSFNIYSTGKLPGKDITESNLAVRPVSYLRKPDYAKLLNTFKLGDRYGYHKNKAVSLINNSIKYSPAKIREIAKLMKLPEAKVKADIFGRNLFEGALEDAPFTKYLRDIADNIGIEGVKTTD